MSFLEKMGILKPKEETPLLVIPKKQTVPAISMTEPNAYLSPEVDMTKFKKLINDVFEERNIPGPDFIEFYKSLKSLDTQAIPLQQKYLFAFSGLSVMGLTKEKIIETSKVYLDALEAKKVEFEKDMIALAKSEVEDKRKKALEIGEKNNELQKQIEQNINSISKLNSEATITEMKISTNTNAFNNVFTLEKQNIETIVSNVNQHL